MASSSEQRYHTWLSWPFGLRLFLAFLVIILLAGLIGGVSVQQFSLLADTTTELNTHDLPEVITLGNLRTLLYRLRALERTIVTSPQPDLEAWRTPLHPIQCRPAAPTDLQHAATLDQQASSLSVATILHELARQCSILLAFEPPNGAGTTSNDSIPVQQLVSEMERSSLLTVQMQVLIKADQLARVRTIEQNQQQPLVQRILDRTTQLLSKEQGEATTAAGQVQQENSSATMLILALTALIVALSLLFALVITRSLTKPLSLLVQAAGTMASGELDRGFQLGRRDEIGRLAAAFDTMRLSLRSTIATLVRERQQTQAIIDASASGVILVDAQRTIVQFNPAAERLSGWRTDEALGQPCWEVFGCRGATEAEAEAHEQTCPLIRAWHPDAGQAATEMQASLRSGQRGWFAVSCAPLPMDEQTTEQRLVVDIHDISQLKAVEQVKSDFVAMVSHELRAPLTTVTGAVETLGLLDPTSERETFYEVTGILQQQTQRLYQVVEEVLQLTRFEAGRLQVHLRPLPLAQLLRSILEQVRTEWVSQDRLVSLHAPQTDVLVWTDRDLLEIVIRNLLDNARKYTPPGSPIEVDVEAGTPAGRVEVRVNDYGPGIPPEQLHSIFERFSRGAQPSSDWTRGYGLGLAIARELLRAQSGDIWAENRTVGASFVLYLCTVQDEALAQAADDETWRTDEHDNSHD
jgi:two-component system, NtrC family, sensor histidine kinase KinB